MFDFLKALHARDKLERDLEEISNNSDFSSHLIELEAAIGELPKHHNELFNSDLALNAIYIMQYVANNKYLEDTLLLGGWELIVKRKTATVNKCPSKTSSNQRYSNDELTNTHISSLTDAISERGLRALCLASEVLKNKLINENSMFEGHMLVVKNSQVSIITAEDPYS